MIAEIKVCGRGEKQALVGQALLPPVPITASGVNLAEMQNTACFEAASRNRRREMFGWTLLLCLAALPGTSLAQGPIPSTAPRSGASITPATPLAKLLEEAEHNNPSIEAARRAWRAAAQEPSQMSTLPDPEVMVQQVNAGSPRPFAGFSQVEMTNLAVGISQEIPYPGKLRLKGEIAGRTAEVAAKRVDEVRRAVGARLKEAYFRLASVQQTLAILARDGKLLDQIEKIAEAHYGVGQGNQQDVLKAQLERTRLLRETTIDAQQRDSLEAALKQVLNRPYDSPDITVEELAETPLPYTSEELLERVRSGNPGVTAGQAAVRRQGLQLELARKDFYPDFSVEYLWEHTAANFPDRYMLGVGVRIPIYRSRRQRPELAQAAEELNQSRHEYEASVQQTYFDVRDRFIAADTGAQMLKIYREGLIPQAMATFRAGLSAYQSGREDFETLLASFLDVLKFDEEYWRVLADHEVALARIEQLTGVTLR